MNAPLRPTGKLPFWEMVGRAYALPLEHAGAIVQMTWAWALILAVGTGALYSLLDAAQLAAIQRGEGLGPASLNLVSLLTGLIVGSSVAVGWHRLLLLGEPQGGGAYLRLDNTVWRYIAVAGLMLLISLPFLAAAFLMSQLTPDLAARADNPPAEVAGWMGLLFIVLLGAMVLAFLLTTRLSLVLPARAIDDMVLTLGDSWRLTQGNFWRLFAGTLACYLPTLVLGGIIASLAGGEGNGSGTFILSTMLSSVAGLVTSVVPLGFLSLAYKQLVSRAAGFTID